MTVHWQADVACSGGLRIPNIASAWLNYLIDDEGEQLNILFILEVNIYRTKRLSCIRCNRCCFRARIPNIASAWLNYLIDDEGEQLNILFILEVNIYRTKRLSCIRCNRCCF